MASATHVILVLALVVSLIPSAEAQLPAIFCTIIEFAVNLLLGCPNPSNFICALVTIMLNMIGCPEDSSPTATTASLYYDDVM